jgi:hypothetical protein
MDVRSKCQYLIFVSKKFQNFSGHLFFRENEHSYRRSPNNPSQTIKFHIKKVRQALDWYKQLKQGLI